MAARVPAARPWSTRDAPTAPGPSPFVASIGGWMERLVDPTATCCAPVPLAEPAIRDCSRATSKLRANQKSANAAAPRRPVPMQAVTGGGHHIAGHAERRADRAPAAHARTAARSSPARPCIWPAVGPRSSRPNTLPPAAPLQQPGRRAARLPGGRRERARRHARHGQHGFSRHAAPRQHRLDAHRCPRRP